MKRIFCILLALATLLCVFPITASADSYSDCYADIVDGLLNYEDSIDVSRYRFSS